MRGLATRISADLLYFNNGVLANGAAWAPGQLGWAVSFDGVSDQIGSIGDHAEMEGLATFTLMAWINVDAFTGAHNAQIFGKTNDYFFGFSGSISNHVSLNVGNGSSYQGLVTNTTVLATGVWYHVTATYTNSTVKFYVNGSLVDTITKMYTMGSNGQNFTVSDNVIPFDGRIDDVRVFN